MTCIARLKNDPPKTQPALQEGPLVIQRLIRCSNGEASLDLSQTRANR